MSTRRLPAVGMRVTVVHLALREPGVIEDVEGRRVRVVTEGGAVHDFVLTTYGWKSAAGVRLLLTALR